VPVWRRSVERAASACDCAVDLLVCMTPQLDPSLRRWLASCKEMACILHVTERGMGGGTVDPNVGLKDC
jgi:hypothetical protein